MKQLLLSLITAGLMITSCDYFETNNDNTYPNSSGELRIFNETSVEIEYTIENPESVTQKGRILPASETDYFETPVGFKQVVITDVASGDTIFTRVTRTGVHDGRKHSIYLSSYTSRLAASGDLPARDTIYVQMALLDQYASFDKEKIKLRTVNVHRESNNASIFAKIGTIDPTIDAPTFSGVAYAGFDITYANLDAGNYNFLVKREDNSEQSGTASLTAGNGYTLLIRADGSLKIIQDN